jgi:hypothetical protein
LQRHTASGLPAVPLETGMGGQDELSNDVLSDAR